MPTETFFNLNEEKRRKIIDACIEEFALNEYRNASISKVVKKLGIAKGSIYQYFENKKELYLYLIQYLSELRLSNLDDLVDRPGITFFDIIRENFAMKIKFDIEYPVYSGFLYNTIEERHIEELGDLMLKMKESIMKLIVPILQRFIDKGEIRDDLDIEIMTYYITQIQLGTYDFFALKYKINYRENIIQKKPVISLSEEEIAKSVRDFTDIMENGLKKK